MYGHRLIAWISTASSQAPQTAQERNARRYEKRLAEDTMCVFLAETMSIAEHHLERVLATTHQVGMVLQTDGVRCLAVQLACDDTVVSVWLANMKHDCGT